MTPPSLPSGNTVAKSFKTKPACFVCNGQNINSKPNVVEIELISHYFSITGAAIENLQTIIIVMSFCVCWQ